MPVGLTVDCTLAVGDDGALCCLNPVLEAERDRAQKYLDVVGTMVIVLDAQARVELVNRRGCEVLGRPAGQIVGRDWFEMVPEADRAALRARFAARLAGEKPPGDRLEFAVRRADGEERIVSWGATVLHDGAGNMSGLLLAGEDVTDQRRYEAQIAYLAYHDSLTGLPNRLSLERFLAETVERARNQRQAVALLYVDLDDFKVINDSLGHNAGDGVLCRLANRLRQLTRPGDFIARQGGDEFLIVIAGIEAEAGRDAEEVARLAAGRLADRVIHTLEQPLNVADTEFSIEASVGVSVFPGDAMNAEQLQRHADAAMYRAKRSGVGVAEYRATSTDPMAKLSMAARLRRALSRDELELHYQPIFRLRDQRILGVEALLRWNDPEHGSVPPGVFIPVAEKAGLIDAVGEWVLAAACRQARQWTEEGLLPNFGINVSPRQLTRPGCADQIVEQIRACGLDPKRFVIEVTESAWLLDRDVAPAIAELHGAGMTVGLDDFGADFSSLSRLRELPVKVMKIDRAFMTDVPAHPRATAIVAAVLQLAESCGCDVVVEGVETADQLSFLREEGCSLAQGFHLARPASAASITAMLHESLAPERKSFSAALRNG